MRRLVTLLLAMCLTVGAATAWGYWGVGSVAGGNGAAAAASVNQGATPTATVVGRAVTVSWPASTLSNGQTVTGYLVKRYQANTLAGQTILAGCSGTITATSCVESSVPAGQWVYSVTPVIGTNWQGAESVKSVAATVAAPTLLLSPATVKPGSSLTGTPGRLPRRRDPPVPPGQPDRDPAHRQPGRRPPPRRRCPAVAAARSFSPCRPGPVTVRTASTPSPHPAATPPLPPSWSTARRRPLPVLTLTPTSRQRRRRHLRVHRGRGLGDRRVSARRRGIRPLRQSCGLRGAGRRLAHLPGARD